MLFSMLLPFAGCKKKPQNDTQTLGPGAVTENGELSDDIPQLDMNELSFDILCRNTDVLYREAYVEELTNDPVSDEIYKRNKWVEARFNCTLNVLGVTESPATTLMTKFRNSVSNGDHEFDLCLDHMMYVAAESLKGTMYDWTDLKYTNFEKPWWHKSLLNEAKYANSVYFAASDYCISSVYFTWLMIFNKTLCENNHIDVYSSVEDGSWTIEKFYNIVKTCYSGTSGDGSVSVGDTYGFATHYNTAVTNWMFALDIPVTSFKNDGEIELKINSDRMSNAVEKVYSLLFESGNGTLYLNNAALSKLGITDHDLAVTTKFAANQLFFAATRIFALENLRSTDVDYGIVPFPKYNEEQENYYSHVDGRASVMFIPTDIEKNDRDNISAVIEALSYGSYTTVMPAIENAALLGRYSSDDTTYRMLEKTLAGRTYAFAYLYRNCCDTKLYWVLSSMMAEGSKSFSSEWRRLEKPAAREYAALSESLNNIGKG